MIRRFAMLLFITFSLSAVAQTEISVDGLNYSLSDDGTATVTGYDRYADTVNVPATVKYGSKEFRVTAIANGAFIYGDLTCISIPESVISIGESVFNDRYWTPQLTSITVDENNPVYNSRNNCNAIIETATNKLIRGCHKTIIPKGVTVIGKNAFSGCKRLESIDIPQGVTAIEESAFAECDSLASVTLPDGLITIGDRAFQGFRCDSPEYLSSLESIRIPESVTSIGKYAFEGCERLTSITIPKGVTTIEEGAFYRCGLKKVIFTDGLKTIGDRAFYNSWLTTIHIPQSVTYIDANAFRHCALESITVDEENPVYDSRNNCNAIIETATNKLIIGCQNTIIPEDITEIGDHAFCGVSNLTKISIPKNVTVIGDRAFYYCDLKTIYCRAPVPILRQWENTDMFYGCKIYVPDEYVEAYKAAEGWKEQTILPIPVKTG